MGEKRQFDSKSEDSPPTKISKQNVTVGDFNIGSKNTPFCYHFEDSDWLVLIWVNDSHFTQSIIAESATKIILRYKMKNYIGDDAIKKCKIPYRNIIKEMELVQGEVDVTVKEGEIVTTRNNWEVFSAENYIFCNIPKIGSVNGNNSYSF